MTIKKPMKVKAAGAPAAFKVRPSGGNGAVADRFKLDAPDPKAQRAAASGGKGTTAAAIAGLVALVVVGFLTYTLWKHWEFLMPA